MGSRKMAAMPSGKITTGTVLTMIAVFIVAKSIPSVGGMPVKEDATKDIITGSEFLSVLLGSDPNNQQLVRDINKKEAPRIDQLKLDNLSDELIFDDSQEHQMNRNSRSSKEEHNKENTLKVDFSNDSSNDDLQSAGSSFYSETTNNERLKNIILNPNDDNVPKIISVRVTSSVAIGRGNNTSQVIEKTPPISENVKETIKNTKLEEGPTTWRPSIFRFLNKDFYNGASSNRHTVSTLPGTLIGANEDYIQQQKEREMNKKKSDVVHPYQRAISYRGNQREGLKPRSYSYSSVINTYADPKLTTINEWSSTKAESVATEATAGYVTIINHNADNSVDEIKDLEVEANFPMKKSIQSVPILPIVYSEPAKIYSEPSKIYSEPAKIYGKPEKIYSEPSKVYSEPAKNYGEPAKIYSEPAKIYGEPAKIYGEPAKIYSQPAYMHESVKENVQPEINNAFKDPNQLFKLNDQKVNGTKNSNDTRGRIRGSNEQNYEVDESVSVNTNGRTHGVQEKPTDDSQKVGYVVEGRNYRKYRVEERTSDGFIVGEYGVVSHDDGSLRGVRYTADGTTNPRLIYDALMKFLSL